jgi:hypothetical protein
MDVSRRGSHQTRYGGGGRRSPDRAGRAGAVTHESNPSSPADAHRVTRGASDVIERTGHAGRETRSGSIPAGVSRR